MEKVTGYTNHIFQAVSAIIGKGENPPKAVITSFVNSWDCTSYELNPLVGFNADTRIAFYQGLYVLDEGAVIEFCKGNRSLKKHSEIDVVAFYETLEEAEIAIEKLHAMCREEHEKKHSYEEDED
jgi:hypothetical protein